MTWVVMLFATVGAGFLQVALPGPALLGQAKWPLLLGVVLYYALHHDGVAMLVAATLAGFVQDALSFIPLGYSSCAFAAVGLAAARFRVLVMGEALVTRAFFGMLGAPLAALIVFVLLLKVSAVALTATALLKKLAGLAVLGAIGVPMVAGAMAFLDRLAGNVRAANEVEALHGELDGITE